MSNYYKVIAIPDETRIIINYGSNDSFEEIKGKHIYIVEKGIELSDPDTDEYLGEFDPIKETLEITEVFDKYSVARKVVISKNTGLQRVISPMLQSTESITYEEIDVNQEDVIGLMVQDHTINIGDFVKIVD